MSKLVVSISTVRIVTFCVTFLVLAALLFQMPFEVFLHLDVPRVMSIFMVIFVAGMALFSCVGFAFLVASVVSLFCEAPKDFCLWLTKPVRDMYAWLRNK